MFMKIGPIFYEIKQITLKLICIYLKRNKKIIITVANKDYHIIMVL
jgi:hypothetical protein